MGRAGIEPATLGLKVLTRRLQVAAAAGSCLQVARRSTAAECTELQVTETVRYSTPYSRTADWARNQLTRAHPLSQPLSRLGRPLGLAD